MGRRAHLHAAVRHPPRRARHRPERGHRRSARHARELRRTRPTRQVLSGLQAGAEQRLTCVVLTGPHAGRCTTRAGPELAQRAPVEPRHAGRWPRAHWWLLGGGGAGRFGHNHDAGDLAGDRCPDRVRRHRTRRVAGDDRTGRPVRDDRTSRVADDERTSRVADDGTGGAVSRHPGDEAGDQGPGRDTGPDHAVDDEADRDRSTDDDTGAPPAPDPGSGLGWIVTP